MKKHHEADPRVQEGNVYIFGGGHVSQELVPVLKRIGYTVFVYEDSGQHSAADMFPGADGIIVHDFTKISDKITFGDADYAVVMTRGHEHDLEVLEQTLKTPVRYVGCMGSASKRGATTKRLREAGVSEDALGKLHSPIGIKIKAETPAEIAISIAAEMILLKAAN